MTGLLFDSFEEFMLARYDIKNYYEKLPYNIKKAYKKYIYNLSYKESEKDAMWCFLNEPSQEWFYEFKLLVIYDKYKKRYNDE